MSEATVANSIFCAKAGGALASYPHAKRVGNIVYLSGLSARQSDDTVRGVSTLPDGSVQCCVKEQAEGIFVNMKNILHEVNADLNNVVDLTVFLVDMGHYADFNQIYNKHFRAESGPARTCVAVSALPGPHLLVEIKAVAHIP